MFMHRRARGECPLLPRGGRGLAARPGLLPDTSWTPRGTTGLWPLPPGRPVVPP